MSPLEGHETQGPQNKKDFEARGEPPKGRPLPTLRENHQMNLRRALEEEMAEVPCDICGSQDHDYRHCQAGALPESQTPGILQSGRADNQGVSERAFAAGAKREDISPWGVPQNSIVNR